MSGLYFEGTCSSDFYLLYTEIHITKQNSDANFWVGLFLILSSVKSNNMKLFHSFDKTFTQWNVQESGQKHFEWEEYIKKVLRADLNTCSVFWNSKKLCK